MVMGSFLEVKTFQQKFGGLVKSFLHVHWTLWTRSGDAIIVNAHILGCYPDAGALQRTVNECPHESVPHTTGRYEICLEEVQPLSIQ